jgi:hypothetical protein
MSEERPIESTIAADIGSTLTHVCLIDIVEGAYRFVAHAESPSTLSEAENDVTIGLRRAIQHLEQLTQRPLLDQDGELITPEQDSGAGVDAFVATSNAAPPLQCVIIGLTDDLSVESAQYACSAGNVLVRETVSLGARIRRWDERVFTSLHENPPDLILLVGGVDTGPVALLENAGRVLNTIYGDIEPERRPVIIFAGNQEARRPVSAILSSSFDLRVVDNVRPNVHVESLGELQRELAQVYERIKLAALPGYRRLRHMCGAPILSTTTALANTLRFVARRDDLAQGVLGIDVGGASTYIGAARGEFYQWAVGAGLGTGFGLDRVLELSGAGNILRWLPVPMSENEISSRLENARLRPYSVPQTMEELLLTHAAIRQALLFTMRKMRRQYWYRPGAKPEEETTPPFDLLAVRGGPIANTPQDGLIALTLLDSLQPVGLVRLVVDWASIWPQLGALALMVPAAAAQVLAQDGLRELGVLIAPLGEARDGARALSLKITPNDGPQTEVEVPAGTVQRFPLAPDQQATVEVRPSRAFDIGMGRRGFGGKAKVRGGSLGIVVDTRGRPLSLPQDAQQRRAKLQEWLRNLVGDNSQSS